MSKAKVSWLLCIGRLVSKTDNVMHFAHSVKQASVDLVSDPFGLWAFCCGAQSPDATFNQVIKLIVSITGTGINRYFYVFGIPVGIVGNTFSFLVGSPILNVLF